MMPCKIVQCVVNMEKKMEGLNLQSQGTCTKFQGPGPGQGRGQGQGG